EVPVSARRSWGPSFSTAAMPWRYLLGQSICHDNSTVRVRRHPLGENFSGGGKGAMRSRMVRGMRQGGGRAQAPARAAVSRVHERWNGTTERAGGCESAASAGDEGGFEGVEIGTVAVVAPFDDGARVVEGGAIHRQQR